jgi:hypothetical protein
MRFWIPTAAGFIVLMYGLGNVANASLKWNSSWTCVTSPMGRRVCDGTKVLFMRADWNWSPSPLVFLAIGLAQIAVGAGLFLVAWRSTRRPAISHAFG